MTASPQALPPVGAKPWPRWLKSWLNAQTGVAWLFILPSVIGFIVFYAVPAIRGVTISLTNWDLLTTPKAVGLQNYVTLLQDKDFWHSMLVTLYYVALNIPMQTGLAILIAVLMDRFTKSFVVRGVLIIPWLIPLVVSGLLFLWILDPTLGILNVFLKFFGISRQPFLGSVTQAMPTVAGINIWRHMGYTALLVFAGLQSIPKDMYEAGAIDGATEWRMFWNLTLPMLRPVLVFVLVTTIIGSFQVFDVIAVTTKGGPVDATRVIIWYIYDFAFARFKMGYATATSIVLFAVLVVVSIVQMRVLRAGESDL
jgi:multiple sugar transport system permease protein